MAEIFGMNGKNCSVNKIQTTASAPAQSYKVTKTSEIEEL